VILDLTWSGRDVFGVTIIGRIVAESHDNLPTISVVAVSTRCGRVALVE
jgi:hypothetical protein